MLVRRLLVGLLTLALLQSGEAYAGSPPVVWLPTGELASSSFVRVDRAAGDEPAMPEGGRLGVEVARGGRVSAQLAVRAERSVRGLRTIVGPSRLPVQVRYAEYIPAKAGGLIADPLREVPSVDVPAGTNQPVWLTITAPERAGPGRYEVPVRLVDASGVLTRQTVVVEVREVALRPMAERPFILDLWAHPDAVAAQHGVELWSERHWQLLRPYLRDLADHGQRVVDVAITQDPWLVEHAGEVRPQTWTAYNSTVAWRWDGQRFSFDFSVFDRYVRESFAAGIKPRIHAFSMLQFGAGERFVYLDTRTGDRVVEEVPLGNARYAAGWGQFLRAFSAHLRRQGWFEYARMAFDERPADTMKIVFDLIAAEAPEWSDRVAIAANSLGVEPFAKDISYELTNLNVVPQDVVDRRRAAGKTTLYYTYGHPVRPNTLTYSPPLSARMLGWVVAQRDLDGYLRWTYNSWPKDVFTDPVFRYNQGDEYIVYPGMDGPVSSIRWELFRDGQDDAELLRLLQDQHGRTDPVFQAAVAAADTAAEATPAAWTRLLESRSAVLSRMTQSGGLAVTGTIRGDSTASGGDAVLLDIAVSNNSSRQLPRPSITPRLPSGWTQRLVDQQVPRLLRPGQSARWSHELTVPPSASGPAWVTGRATAGQAVAGLAVPLTITAPVIVDEVAAPTWSSPDGQTPIQLSVPVRNVSRSAKKVEIGLTGAGSWHVPAPVVLDLAAGASTTANFRLEPRGSTGWTTMVLRTLVGGAELDRQAIDVVSGGRHVSDLPWVAESNGWGPAERDRSNGEDAAADGAWLTIGGRSYRKGIGAHAPSRIEVALDGKCSRFQADVGVDDEMPVGNVSSIRFEVLIDGERRYVSPVLGAADPALFVDVDVTGGQSLELVIEDGGNGIGQDHGDWAGAWLRCTG